MPSSAFIDLLGPSLVDKSGTVATEKALEGKSAVALYFSAHWCPPCRGFTPALAKAYTSALKAKGLEVVFVSSDKTEKEFASYFGEMPWLALPYDDRAAKARLSKKFKVSGIPSLIILDGASGETITADGREAVSEDPKGAKFPWKPPDFWTALGSEFLKGTDGETVDVEEIKGEGKVIGLYFSAHWCPPCRAFTPQLVDAYEAHLKAKGLSLIFVSSDRSQSDFKEYFATMPWLAIPNGDPRKEALSKRFGVRGIPSLVLVDALTGETINGNARGQIAADAEGADFPWRPKPLVNLCASADGLNEELSLLVMMDGCDAETVAKAKAVLEPIAEKAKADKDDTLFFYADSDGGPVGRVRELTNLGKPTATPQMLLLDIPDEGGFYVSDASEVTAESVAGFLEAYKAKTLERKQLEKK